MMIVQVMRRRNEKVNRVTGISCSPDRTAYHSMRRTNTDNYRTPNNYHTDADCFTYIFAHTHRETYNSYDYGSSQVDRTKL